MLSDWLISQRLVCMERNADLTELEQWIRIIDRMVRLGLVDDCEWWVDYLSDLWSELEVTHD